MGDSARRLIENLSPLSAENIDLAKLLKNVFRTSLILDIDNEPGQCIVVQARGNGNCLFNNSTLPSLCGDKLQSSALCLLCKVSNIYNDCII